LIGYERRGLSEETVAEAKHHHVALDAVDNKPCHFVYAGPRDRRPYEPRR
jgi:hypothetical protein